MFPYQIAKSGLTLSKVITGISKSLSIANQVIPIYQQSKPVIDKAKEMLSGISKKEPQKKEIIKNDIPSSNNNPTFF